MIIQREATEKLKKESLKMPLSVAKANVRMCKVRHNSYFCSMNFRQNFLCDLKRKFRQRNIRRERDMADEERSGKCEVCFAERVYSFVE